MATIEQVKALMRMHFEGNNEKFKSISLQIAAHEAKIGHTASAREIKDLIQNPKYIAKQKHGKGILKDARCWSRGLLIPDCLIWSYLKVWKEK